MSLDTSGINVVSKCGSAEYGETARRSFLAIKTILDSLSVGGLVDPGALGGVLVSNGAGAWVRGTLETLVAPGAAGQVLRTADGITWSAGAPTLTETSTSTVLTPAAIPANSVLVRSGDTLIGVAPSVAGSIIQWSGTAWVDSSRAAAIATTSTPGLVLANTTAATAGVPVQYSTALQLSSTAWASGAGASVVESWRIECRPVSGSVTSSTVCFLRSTGGGAYTLHAAAAPSLVSPSPQGYLHAWGLSASGIVLNTADNSTGIGSSSSFRSTAEASAVALIHTGRTDGANNIVFASCYDRNAASITNAATMRLHSFGWTSNSDAYTEVAAVYCDGTVWGYSFSNSRAAAIATTSTAGLTLANTTAATSGVPIQYSPAIQLSGTAHDTDGDVSVAHHCRTELRPLNGNTTTSALHWLFATDTGAHTGRMSISNTGYLTIGSACEVSTYFRSSGAGFYIKGGNDNTGLGECMHVRCDTAANPLMLLHTSRTDGANNIVIAEVYDRAAASITNAATMRLHSFGWTNNADAYTEVAAVYCDGSFWLAAAGGAGLGVSSGAGCKWGSFIEELTIVAGGVTSTTTAQVPAGAVVYACSARVTTILPGAVTWALGFAGATTLFATGLAAAAGTTTDGTIAPSKRTSAGGVVVTASGDPGAATGKIRIACMWYLGVAPTA